MITRAEVGEDKLSQGCYKGVSGCVAAVLGCWRYYH